jgi:hypothetical protein
MTRHEFYTIAMISLLSKFRRPRPRQSEPSRESRSRRTLRTRMIRHATNCDNKPRAASCGVFERSDRNSNRDKSKLGSTRYPAILVAQGNCTDKGELSNLLGFLQAKGGVGCLKLTRRM